MKLQDLDQIELSKLILERLQGRMKASFSKDFDTLRPCNAASLGKPAQSLIPQTTLHVGYINMDRLTWSKFELFTSNFTSGLDQSHYDFLALAEVGEKMRQELDKQCWLASEPATHSSEGLAVFVKTSIRRHIIKVNRLSPRDIAITLLTQHGTVTFFFVYAPGENYPQKTYAEFLENIENQMREDDKHEVVLIGDINAKLSRGQKSYTGPYGLHYKNSKRSSFLLNFLEKHALTVMNSWLRTSPSTKNSTKLGKHKTFQAKSLKPNQISELDLIIVKQSHINTISRFKIDWSLISTFRKDKYDHGMLHLWYRPQPSLTRIPVNFVNLR